MSPSRKWQFSLKHLLIAITIFSLLAYAVIYAYEPHLIEDGRYQITVDYSRTLEEMIKAGKYDWVHPNITPANFPLDPDKSGTEPLEAVIVHLDKYVDSTGIVFKLLDKKGLRPATLPELLALGEKYPELQRKFWLSALGSRSQRGGDWLVPYLDRWRAERWLDLRGWCAGWLSHGRFLAFRKPR